MTSPFSFFINSHLAWLPPTHYSPALAELSEPFSPTASHRSIVTLSGRLNVWIAVSRARPPEWQWVGIASPPLSGPRHSGLRFQTSRSWSVSEQGINLLWHTDSPLGGRPALGSGPTALPIAARVMQGVREAGMDGGTGVWRDGGERTEGGGMLRCWISGWEERDTGRNKSDGMLHGADKDYKLVWKDAELSCKWERNLCWPDLLLFCVQNLWGVTVLSLQASESCYRSVAV